MSGKMIRAMFGAVLLVSALGVSSMLVRAHGPAGQDPTPAPDNTKVNKRDQSKTEPTADQQKENASDLNITRRIRRAVMQRQITLQLRSQREDHYSGGNGDIERTGPVRRGEAGY